MSGNTWRNVSAPEWRAVIASTASIAESETEHELIQRICEAAVDASGYSLVWYGRKTYDLRKSVIPIAGAGPSVGYLDSIDITWSDEPSGDGPAGVSIKTEKPCIITNVDEEASFAPWRDRARKYGIKFCIAVPVKIGGVVDGALCVYGADSLSFDETNFTILTELCAQIGVGLGRMRYAQLVDQALENTITVLSTTMEIRDPYTAGHQAGVADLSEKIATRMGLVQDEVHAVWLAGSVHDIGKISVPTDLLTKPSRLRETEMNLIREHAIIGENLMKTAKLPWDIAKIVGQHHERLDGSGYPRGTGGDKIIMPSRILMVADVVEAMGHNRPYRVAKGVPAALEYLHDNVNVKYDEAVVDTCIKIFEDGYTFSPLEENVEALTEISDEDSITD